MSKQIWDKDITKYTDWGGDESTGYLPVSGEKVQKFIKDSLENKAGCFYLDKSINKYYIFADETDRDIYLADPEHHAGLVIGEIQLEPMYELRVNPITPPYTPVFLGDKGNYIRYTFETVTKSGSVFNENVDAVYTIQCGNSVVTVNESYSAGQTVAFNIDKYLLEGSNYITVDVKGQVTEVSTKAQWTFEVVNLSISDDFDLTNVYRNGDTLTVRYDVSGNLLKYIEWWIDGVKVDDDYIGPAITSTKYIELNGFGSGRHNLQYRAYVTVSNGAKFYSNTLSRDFVVDDELLDHTLILTKITIPSSTQGIVPGIIDMFTEPIPLHGPVQYEEYNIEYSVYSKTGLNLPPMIITLGDAESSYDTQVGYMYTYTIRSLEEKTSGIPLVFAIDNEDLVFNAYIEKSDYDLETPAGAVFEFNGSDRTNSSKNRDTWSYKGYTGELEGFSWIETSGWNDGRLVIPDGASFTTDYKPFVDDPKINGFTLDIEFRTSRVTNENAPIIDLTSLQGKGLLITASEIIFSSQGNTQVSTKYKPEEDIRVSIVVNPWRGQTYPRLLFIYIDGVLSGAVEYLASETFAINEVLSVNGSDGAVVYLKQILCYNRALSPDEILTNYILYRDSVTELVDAYDRNDIYEEGTVNISESKLASRTPIIIITGDVEKLQNFGKEDKGTYVRMDKIEVINQQDPTRNMTLINPSMRCQGTSSMEYPRKNFRFYTQADSKDETQPAYTTRMFDYLGNELTGKQRLYSFKKNAQPVKTWCLKADYAESSSTHNTGIARLWNDVMKNARIPAMDIDERFYLKDIFPESNTPCRTIAQHEAEIHQNDFPYDVRTTVDGYPISLFYHLHEEDPLIFIGRYNWNNDKSTESVFGFTGIPGFEPWENTMECWEVINGDFDINQFVNLSLWDDVNKGWRNNFEARYPDDAGKASEAERARKASGSDPGGALWQVSSWINSTLGASKVDDDPTSHTYNKMIVDDPILMNKFKSEKWNHLDVYKIAAYYVYLMRFGAVDQTVKNAMFTTEDGIHWYYINYDNDTIIGVRNDGALKFGYDITRQSKDPDAPTSYCYAGHASVLWNNLEADDEFMDIVRIVDNALYNAKLSYSDSIDMFNIKQSAQWAEKTHNEDYKFKYLDGISRLQLPKLQGPRKSHRQWWLSNRFAIYDAMNGTDAYISNRIAIKPAGTATPGPNDYVTVTPAVNGQIFGFGYETPEELGVRGEKDVPITFYMNQDYYIGTTIKFYNAVYFKEIDLSRISKHINEIDFSRINTSAFDSNITSFILGDSESEINTSMNTLPDLGEMKYLEKFQMMGYNGISGLDLSENSYLKQVYLNDCDNLTNITLPTAAPLNTIVYPSNIQTIDMHDLVSLTNLSVQGHSANVKSITINNCPNITSSPDFILDWLDNKVSPDSECSLTLDNVAWNNISNEDLSTIAEFAKNAKLVNGEHDCHLRGYASISGTIQTPEEAQLYMDAFGSNVFDASATFHIIAPPTVFFDGPDSVLEGAPRQSYRAIVIGDSGRYTLTYRVATTDPTHMDSIDSNGWFTTKETANPTQVISLVCTYISSTGDVHVYFKEVTVEQRTYPTVAQTTIVGPSQIQLNEPAVYTIEYSVDVTGIMSANWTVTGDIVDYVTVEGDLHGCTITLTSAPTSGFASGNLNLTLTRVAQTAPAWSITVNPKVFGYQSNDIAVSRLTNPYAMNVLYNKLHSKGLCESPDKMLKSEAAQVLDADLVYDSSSSIFSANSEFKNNCTNFDEFKYFIGLRTLCNYCFYGCNKLESIILPTSLTSIGNSAFQNCTWLTSITIPDGVTLIGDSAFSGCTGLTSVTIPDGVISISTYAFYGCTGLTSVTIPASVTSITNMAFYGCTGLTSVTMYCNVPYRCFYITNSSSPFYGCTNINSVTLGEGVKTIGISAFQNCTWLTSITIPDGVTLIGDSAFSGCTGLTSVTIPDGVISISTYAFYGCTGLTSVTIPASVTSISSGAFYNCTGLTSVTMYCNVPSSCFYIVSANSPFYQCTNINSVTLGEGVKTIGNNAFNNCKWLTSITIPDSVTSIGDSAFSGCTKLASITIPDGVTSIGTSAFYGCTGLTSITIPDSVTLISNYAFSGCTGITSVTMYCNVPDYCFYAKSYSAPFYGCTNINSITLGEGVKTIGQYAFSDCTSLTSITIPDGVTTFGSYAFYSCTKLASITIPDSVTTIGQYVFSGCTSLTSITIPDEVTTIGTFAFYNCTGLTSVSIPDSITSIGYGVFWNCTSLASITIPDSVTSISEYAFRNCTNLTSITIPDGVTTFGVAVFQDCTELTSVTMYCNVPNNCFNITNSSSPFCGCININSIILGEGVETIGGRAFYNCTNLTSITIPSTVNSINISASGDMISFRNCYSLESITIDQNNTVYNDGGGSDCIIVTSTNQLIVGCKNTIIPNTVTSIGISAFFGNGLTSITIPNSVTTIGDYAFSDCTSLTSITIPDGVTTIGQYAFQDCVGITSVIISDSVTAVGAYAFQGCAGLTSVTLSENMTSLQTYVFKDCVSLTSINIPANISSISSGAAGPFVGCTSLVTITVDSRNSKYVAGTSNCIIQKSDNQLIVGCKGTIIPNSVTSIYEGAFYDSGITSINIPSSVTSIGQLIFGSCNDLTTITVDQYNNTYEDGGGNCIIQKSTNTLIAGCKGTVIPNTVTSIGNYAFYQINSEFSMPIPEGVTSIGNYAFSYCDGLTSVTLPSTLTSINSAAFYYCAGLTSVTVCCSSVKQNWLNSYSNGCFYNCNNISNIVFAEGVQRIENGCVGGGNYLSKLTSIEFPSTITYIGSSNFKYCSNLKVITSKPTIPPSITSTSFPAVSSLNYIYVPSESVNTYKSASNWNTYSVVIYPISE